MVVAVEMMKKVAVVATVKREVWGRRRVAAKRLQRHERRQLPVAGVQVEGLQFHRHVRERHCGGRTIREGKPWVSTGP